LLIDNFPTKKYNFKGSLIGDCIGGRMFDSMWGPEFKDILKEYASLRDIVSTYDKNADLTSLFIIDDIKRYTYDIMFIHATCDSFQQNDGRLNLYDIISRFITCYKQDQSERGYASGAVNLFNKLKKLEMNQQLERKFYYPAFELFNGEGSLGNGAGMRCSPVALYTLEMSEYEMQVSILIESY
jgi:hypothetical protein